MREPGVPRPDVGAAEERLAETQRTVIIPFRDMVRTNHVSKDIEHAIRTRVRRAAGAK